MTTEHPAQLALFEGSVMEEAVLMLGGKVELRPSDDLLAALRLGRPVVISLAVGAERVDLDATVTVRTFTFRNTAEGAVPVTKTRVTLNRVED